MRGRLIQIFGAEAGEEPALLLLLMRASLAGIFLGAYGIGAHSLFLSLFTGADMALAYLFSGIAGMLLLPAVMATRPKSGVGLLQALKPLLATLTAISLWLILTFNPSGHLVFATFVLIGPLALLVFGGLANGGGRGLAAGSRRPLLNVAEAGVIAGIAIGAFLTPLLIAIGFAAADLIGLAAVAAGVAAMVSAVAGSSVCAGKGSAGAGAMSPPSARHHIIRPHTLYTGLLITLSVVVTLIIHYCFISAVRATISGEREIANLLGLYTGTVMLFLLPVRLWLYPLLLRSGGMRRVLLAPPVATGVLALVVALATVIPGGAGFTLSLALFALLCLLSCWLKGAVEIPSIDAISEPVSALDGRESLYYLLLPGKVAAILSGTLLSVTALLVADELKVVSLLLIAVTLLWYLAALRVYRKQQRPILHAISGGGALSDRSGAWGEGAPHRHRTGGAASSEEARGGAEYASGRPDAGGDITSNRTMHDVTAAYSPGEIHSRLLIRRNLFAITMGNIDLFALSGMEGVAVWLGKMALNNPDRAVARALSRLAVSGHLSDDNRKLLSDAAVRCRECLRSYDLLTGEERSSEAAGLLHSERRPQYTQLLRLFREGSAESVRASLFAIGRDRCSEMIPEVCMRLGVASLSYDARAVLHRFGSDCSGELIRFFMRNSGNTRLVIQLAYIMSQTAFNETADTIYRMLSIRSGSIRGRAAMLLAEKGWRTPDSDRKSIYKLISDSADTLIWLQEACKVSDSMGLSRLTSSLDDDKRWCSELLLNLLSLACGTDAIKRIRENIERGGAGGATIALDTVAMVLDEPARAVVMRAVADLCGMPERDRLTRLSPAAISTAGRFAEEVLTRDYNTVSLATRAAAIGALTPQNIDEGCKEILISLLFSPQRILVEESARALAATPDEAWKSVMTRLPENNRDIVSALLNGAICGAELLSVKSRFLKSHMGSLPSDDIISLAEMVRFCRSDDMVGEGGVPSICWRLDGDSSEGCIGKGWRGDGQPADDRGHNGGSPDDTGGNSFYQLSIDSMEGWLAGHDEHFETLMLLADMAGGANSDLYVSDKDI